MDLNLEFVRSQFPSLAGDWTFLDNAGGSQILAAVVRRIQEYLMTSNVQLGASYAVSQRAGERQAEAALAMATLVNAAEARELVMGPSTSMLLRVLAICLGETLAEGDEIVVTNCDHEANIGPWTALEARGAKIRTWRVNPDSLELELSDLAALMNERTRLVTLTHSSNILGRVNPIAAIARLVHERGALICVDGVAFAPHRSVDVRALDVDFYALSSYKVYGPHHAMLYGKSEHLLRLPGFNHFFIGQEDIPYKFQPGGANYELSYGMLGLWDYLEDFADAHGLMKGPEDRRALLVAAFELIAGYEEKLSTRMLDFLASKPRVRVIGPTTADRATRLPTISFVVEGRASGDIVAEVDRHRIGIRYGDFYARRLIDDLNLTAGQGVVRVSMVHYNTLAELDHLVAALDPLL